MRQGGILAEARRGLNGRDRRRRDGGEQPETDGETGRESTDTARDPGRRFAASARVFAAPDKLDSMIRAAIFRGLQDELVAAAPLSATCEARDIRECSRTSQRKSFRSTLVKLR